MCVQASVLLSHVLAPPDVLLQFVRVLIGQLSHLLFQARDLPCQTLLILPVLRGQLAEFVSANR